MDCQLEILQLSTDIHIISLRTDGAQTEHLLNK